MYSTKSISTWSGSFMVKKRLPSPDRVIFPAMIPSLLKIAADFFKSGDRKDRCSSWNFSGAPDENSRYWSSLTLKKMLCTTPFESFRRHCDSTAVPGAVLQARASSSTKSRTVSRFILVGRRPVVGIRGRIGLFAVGFAHGDRKSTRLNSSHLGISYAVFCL